MTPFEFYLAFFGLLLGLSVATVASGFLDAIGARQRVTFGWLTPTLAVFVFLDITTGATNATSRAEFWLPMCCSRR